MRMMQRDSQNGFALLLVLMIVALLAVVAAHMSLSSQVELAVASNRSADLRNGYALRAGLVEAQRFLQFDLQDDTETARMVDDLDEEWPLPRTIEAGELTVTIRIRDESARFHVNRLVNAAGEIDSGIRERYDLLLSKVFLGEAVREDLIEALVDWMDRTPADVGEEEGNFEADAKNAPLDTVEEIRMVPGYSREILYGGVDETGEKRTGLIHRLTRWTDGRVNLNTAPPEVLYSLSTYMTDSKVDAILDYRREHPFENVAEISQVPGIDDGYPLGQNALGDLGPKCRVNSSFFRVSLESASGRPDEPRGWTGRADVVVVRSAAGVNVLYWDPDPPRYTDLSPPVAE